MDIQERLAALRGSQPEVRGAVLARTDGTVIASALGPGLDGSAPSASAMVAALLGIARRVAAMVGDGGLDEVVLNTSTGTVVVRAVGDDEVLTLLADARLNLARMQLELRHVVPELAARSRVVTEAS